MANRKFSDKELLDFVDRLGLSQPEAAKRLGVSKQAVNQRMKELRTGAVKVAAVKGAQDVFDGYISAVDQFRKISENANAILDLAMGAVNGDPDAITRLSDKVDDQDETTKPKIKDPFHLALQSMAEVRNQLRLQAEVLHTLTDIFALSEFQKEVLEAIGEVSPEMRHEIIDRLNRRSAIHSAMRFH